MWEICLFVFAGTQRFMKFVNKILQNFVHMWYYNDIWHIHTLSMSHVRPHLLHGICSYTCWGVTNTCPSCVGVHFTFTHHAESSGVIMHHTWFESKGQALFIPALLIHLPLIHCNQHSLFCGFQLGLLPPGHINLSFRGDKPQYHHVDELVDQNSDKGSLGGGVNGQMRSSLMARSNGYVMWSHVRPLLRNRAIAQ